jgi:hypothetical protein
MVRHATTVGSKAPPTSKIVLCGRCMQLLTITAAAGFAIPAAAGC